MQTQHLMMNIPNCTWQRPIGLGWDKPYTVRTASNLDDGPWHGMPLGGFGAGCIGRSSRGDFNLWQVDGGEHIFQSIPGIPIGAIIIVYICRDCCNSVAGEDSSVYHLISL